jgi:ComF family protein
MFDWLFTILFPMHCLGCRKSGVALCAACCRTIRLAATLPNKTFAAFDYNNPLVQKIIRDLKYHHRSESARALAQYAIPYITEYLSDFLQHTREAVFILVPIPEHTRKLKSKGFNHSALLASWWSNTLTGSAVNNAVYKTTFTLPQARLNRGARMKNVAHTMSVRTVLDPTSIYLVIDDVTTTGATFDEARRALRAAGAIKIISIALAHGFAKK